jgi:hypothetical protein
MKHSRPALVVLLPAVLAALLACSGEGGDVGSTCGDNADCDPDLYCDKAIDDCDGAGTCQVRPDTCIEVLDPVCGCDGATYDNACFANTAGTSVRHRGECP